MFQGFFSMVRNGIKQAILGGFDDAAAEINERAAKLSAPAEEAPKPVNRIESSNGKAKGGVR